MSTPCEQKESIESVWDKIGEQDKTLTILQVKQVEIGGDVAHIKTRIDNGMSKTIQRIDENLVQLKPIIEHHADIVRRIEDIGWLISKTALVSFLLAVIGVLVWAIAKGYKP